MPTACFQTKFSQSAIDAEKGILTGVKLMALGKLAQFAGEGDEVKKVTITRQHIEALLSHAGNRAVPIHLTHEWADSQGKPNADSIEMLARIGALKNLRKDNVGDLIADAYLKEGSIRNDILFGAEHNPEDNMFSVVFDYKKSDPECLPINFRAADIVPTGAAVTALFKHNPTAKMAISIDDLKEVCSTPEGKEMLRSAIKGHDKATEDAESTAAATMESDAGVIAADKKSSDDTMPATMRAQVRIARATTRLVAELKVAKESLETTKTAILEQAKTDAAAEATAMLGKSGFPKLGSDGKPETATAKFNAAVAELKSKGVKEGAATLAVMKEQEPLYKAMQVERGIFKA